VEEAQLLGHDHVGTEHLLLALVREGEGIAAGVLQTFGALGKVREFTLAALQQRAATAGQESPGTPQGTAV
jgi:ATP-dependent Clp protease ATP-binding subunit ClpC